MKLLCTVWLDPPNRSTPRPFAEMMLRALTVVPPMRSFEPPSIMPLSVFPRARVPVTSVPIRLPCTMFPVPPIEMPEPIFPEIKLRASGVVPPITLFEELAQRIIQPCPTFMLLFGCAIVPVGSVPRKFPTIKLPLLEQPIGLVTMALL